MKVLVFIVVQISVNFLFVSSVNPSRRRKERNQKPRSEYLEEYINILRDKNAELLNGAFKQEICTEMLKHPKVNDGKLLGLMHTIVKRNEYRNIVIIFRSALQSEKIARQQCLNEKLLYANEMANKLEEALGADLWQRFSDEDAIAILSGLNRFSSSLTIERFAAIVHSLQTAAETSALIEDEIAFPFKFLSRHNEIGNDNDIYEFFVEKLNRIKAIYRITRNIWRRDVLRDVPDALRKSILYTLLESSRYLPIAQIEAMLTQIDANDWLSSNTNSSGTEEEPIHDWMDLSFAHVSLSSTEEERIVRRMNEKISLLAKLSRINPGLSVNEKITVLKMLSKLSTATISSLLNGLFEATLSANETLEFLSAMAINNDEGLKLPPDITDLSAKRAFKLFKAVRRLNIVDWNQSQFFSEKIDLWKILWLFSEVEQQKILVEIAKTIETRTELLGVFRNYKRLCENGWNFLHRLVDGGRVNTEVVTKLILDSMNAIEFIKQIKIEDEFSTSEGAFLDVFDALLLVLTQDWKSKIIPIISDIPFLRKDQLHYVFLSSIGSELLLEFQQMFRSEIHLFIESSTQWRERLRRIEQRVYNENLPTKIIESFRRLKIVNQIVPFYVEHEIIGQAKYLIQLSRPEISKLGMLFKSLYISPGQAARLIERARTSSRMYGNLIEEITLLADIQRELSWPASKEISTMEESQQLEILRFVGCLQSPKSVMRTIARSGMKNKADICAILNAFQDQTTENVCKAFELFTEFNSFPSTGLSHSAELTNKLAIIKKLVQIHMENNRLTIINKLKEISEDRSLYNWVVVIFQYEQVSSAELMDAIRTVQELHQIDLLHEISIEFGVMFQQFWQVGNNHGQRTRIIQKLSDPKLENDPHILRWIKAIVLLIGDAAIREPDSLFDVYWELKRCDCLTDANFEQLKNMLQTMAQISPKEREKVSDALLNFCQQILANKTNITITRFSFELLFKLLDSSTFPVNVFTPLHELIETLSQINALKCLKIEEQQSEVLVKMLKLLFALPRQKKERIIRRLKKISATVNNLSQNSIEKIKELFCNETATEIRQLWEHLHASDQSKQEKETIELIDSMLQDFGSTILRKLAELSALSELPNNEDNGFDKKQFALLISLYDGKSRKKMLKELFNSTPNIADLQMLSKTVERTWKQLYNVPLKYSITRIKSDIRDQINALKPLVLVEGVTHRKQAIKAQANRYEAIKRVYEQDMQILRIFFAEMVNGLRYIKKGENDNKINNNHNCEGEKEEEKISSITATDAINFLFGADQESKEEQNNGLSVAITIKNFNSNFDVPQHANASELLMIVMTKIHQKLTNLHLPHLDMKTDQIFLTIKIALKINICVKICATFEKNGLNNEEQWNEFLDRLFDSKNSWHLEATAQINPGHISRHYPGVDVEYYQEKCLEVMSTPFLQMSQSKTTGEKSIFSLLAQPEFECLVPPVEIVPNIEFAADSGTALFNESKFLFGAWKLSDQCPICLDKLSHAWSGADKFPCEHRFHKACKDGIPIKEELSQAYSLTCPKCRSTFIFGNEEDSI